MLERVLREIRARRRFIVTSHARPDGDGIGSALACGQILRVMGKEADVVMHDGVPRIYQNLPFADRAIQADAVPSNDAVILLECDSIKRTLLEGLEECFLINIDHQASGRNFAQFRRMPFPRTMPSSCSNATASSARCSRVLKNASSSTLTITPVGAISPRSTGSIPR